MYHQHLLVVLAPAELYHVEEVGHHIGLPGYHILHCFRTAQIGCSNRDEFLYLLPFSSQKHVAESLQNMEVAEGMPHQDDLLTRIPIEFFDGFLDDSGGSTLLHTIPEVIRHHLVVHPIGVSQVIQGIYHLSKTFECTVLQWGYLSGYPAYSIHSTLLEPFRFGGVAVPSDFYSFRLLISVTLILKP